MFQVFNHDWFATPFIMMTCQVTINHYNNKPQQGMAPPTCLS